MDEITRIAAFTGNPMAETAISELLWTTGDLIADYGLTLPDGSEPPEDWPCAIFKPEADMYRFDLRCENDGLLMGEPACRGYGLPDGIGSAVYMILAGGRGQVEGFCQAVCDLSGMDCHLMADTDGGYVPEKTMAPMKERQSVCSVLNLMFDPDD